MPEEKTKTDKESSETSEKQKSNKTLIIILSVAAGLLVIGAVVSTVSRAVRKAGQKAVEETVEQAIEKGLEEAGESVNGDVEVDISDEGKELTIETEEGTFTAGQQEIPDNFPEDMPIYPDSTVTSTASAPDNVAVILLTQDSVAKVAAFYKSEFVDEGWEITSTSTIENATVYAVEKGDMSGAVIINQTDDGTQITIDVQLVSEE